MQVAVVVGLTQHSALQLLVAQVVVVQVQSQLVLLAVAPQIQAVVVVLEALLEVLVVLE
jgi:hypothetical protein